MAIRRTTTTTTVTEHIDESAISLLDPSAQTLGSSSTSLGEIKANATRADAEVEAEPTAEPIKISAPKYGDPVRFGTDLSAWIGHHSAKFLIGLFALASSVIGLIWLIASTYSTAALKLQGVENNVRELGERTQNMSDRLIRIEVREGETSSTRRDPQLENAARR